MPSQAHRQGPGTGARLSAQPLEPSLVQHMSRVWAPAVPLITRFMKSRTAVERDAMFLPLGCVEACKSPYART